MKPSNVLKILGEAVDLVSKPNEPWRSYEITVPQTSPEGSRSRLISYEEDQIGFPEAGEKLNLLAGAMDSTAAGLFLLPNMMENVEAWV